MSVFTRNVVGLCARQSIKLDGRSHLARCLFGVFVIASWTALAHAEIPWKSGPSQLRDRTPEQLRLALDLWAGRPNQRHVVIQFDRPLRADQRGMFEGLGLRLLNYLGDNAYFASLPGRGLNADAIARSPLVRGAETIERGWKLHPMITANRIPEHAIVDRTNADDPTVAAYVQFHGDVDLARLGVEIARGHGATVRDRLESINTLVCELAQSRITALADEDAVQWIEPPLPRFSEVNDDNRVLTQVDALQSSPFNLDGSGVGVMVYDGGSGLASHADFSGRLTVRDSSGLSDHSTHVAGTIGGDGTLSGGLRRGMAPAVLLESYGFQWDGTGTFLYSNPGDLESDYTDAVINRGADIANNSIGTNTETNGFACEIQGDYGVTSQLIDAIARGSLGAPFRIVWANGNERQGSRCDVEGYGDYYSTAPPAGAKNHIAVGALNSNSEGMTSFSSWGPTDDGRMKPDISASGCQSNDDGGVTSTSSGGGYSVKCGTSMAAPTVTGLCSLILQDYRARYPAQPDPRNSTLKALLAHTAKDKGNPGPDYQFGYGMVKGEEAIAFLRGGSLRDDQVGQDGSVSFQTIVTAADFELKVTLAWDDAPGTPNINPALINDLDLVVTSPSGAQAYPWTLDPLDPAARAVRIGPNSVDNLEQVYVESPEAGTWTIDVQGSSVPQGPQPFSICISPTLLSDGVTISLPDGAPDVLVPNTNTTIGVEIVAINEILVSGSETLVYRYGGGAFQSIPLSSLGGGLYEAVLPPAACSDAPEFYFRAAGTVSGPVTLPAGAPSDVFTAGVGQVTIVLHDDMETDQGWSVGAPGDTATTGVWTRVDPIGTEAQPEDDHSPAPGTNCFVTGQGSLGGTLGENDIDGGQTTLFSPMFDLSAYGNATISYSRWFNNATGASPNTDLMTVEISSDGGSSWTNVETVGPTGAEVVGGWIRHEFQVEDFVSPTAQMMLRFVAADADPGSVVEAAIDDVQVTGFECAAAICSVAEDCDDGDACTTDSCSAGSCINVPVDCNDGDACTADSCDPGSGSCLNNPISCDDGVDCTVDTCDAITGCSNTPLDCDDLDACTSDSCVGGACFNDPISCDDLDPCTVDSCDSVTGCDNLPVVCPPGETCADGFCVPQTCDDDGACEDGEDCDTCPGDCPTGPTGCGNGVCEQSLGEDCANCAQDCNGRLKGRPDTQFCCGADVDCTDVRCIGDGFDCSDASLPASCCGDSICNGVEDSCTCEVDCGLPGAEICDNGLDDDCDGFIDGSDTDCPCAGKGGPCMLNMDCCSGECKRNGTCR